MNEPTPPARVTRPFLMIALALATLPLGCGGRVEMALVDPDKFQFHTCVQLEREMKKLRDHAKELRVLYDKAARDSTAVAKIAYEADYLSTIGDMQLIETAARDKNCEPPLSATTPATAVPPPAR
jgi:hypothetical protein